MTDGEFSLSSADSEEEARAAASIAVSNIIEMVSQTCAEYQNAFVAQMIGSMLAMMTVNCGPKSTRMVMQAMIDKMQKEH